MLTYLKRRIFHALFVIFGVVTLVFLMMRVLPGDPAYIMAGPIATLEEVNAMRQTLGLDQPIYIQYWVFLKQLVTLDFGKSIYQNNVPAATLILERFPATLELVIPSLFISVILAFALGSIAALQYGKWSDGAMGVIALIGQATPSFWLGPMLIIFFARDLHWLPTSGRGGVLNTIMPVVTLSLPLFAVTTRMVRSGLLDILGKDYVRTARAKGLKERLVIIKHVYQNMLIPVITYTGLQLGHMLSGAVIVETIFAWPGVGRLMVESITNRDYNVVQVAVIFFAGFFVLINIIVDFLYVVIDPRIRLS